jgi:hypothetical protein
MLNKLISMIHFTNGERDMQVRRMNQLVLTWNDREDSCLVGASRSTKLTGTSHSVVRQDVKLIFPLQDAAKKGDMSELGRKSHSLT